MLQGLIMLSALFTYNNSERDLFCWTSYYDTEMIVCCLAENFGKCHAGKGTFYKIKKNPKNKYKNLMHLNDEV